MLRWCKICFILLFAAPLLTACLDESERPDDLTDAREYMRHRDFIEAEKSFERYLRRNPDGQERLEVWNNLVDIALNVRHDRNAAIELLEAMTIEYEVNSLERRMVQERLAEEYEQNRNYVRAMELWIALEKNPGTPEIKKAALYRNMARVYLRRLEFELAKEALGLCMALDIPQSTKAECQYDLADAYLVMENIEEAINELGNLLNQEGIDDDLRVLSVFMLADALEQQGKKQEALDLFESIRFSYPNTSVVEARIEYLHTEKQ
jgi:tetratricopeptide (TPR) repeat protein